MGGLYGVAVKEVDCESVVHGDSVGARRGGTQKWLVHPESTMALLLLMGLLAGTKIG